MSVIQGFDTIPRGLVAEFGGLFQRLLPDGSINAQYNFQAGASTQKAAAQLNVLVQNASHPSKSTIVVISGGPMETALVMFTPTRRR